MSDKKEVKNEIENVSGGAITDEVLIHCDNCGKAFEPSGASGHRTIEDGCDSYDEYKCPGCGTWKKG